MTARPKPGSKVDRDRLRGELSSVGCTPGQIATEMRARWGMRPREALRHAHGWTLQELSDRLAELTADLPGVVIAADASLIAKWEKWPGGGRRPTLQSLALLSEAFGVPVLDLFDLEDVRALPDSDLRVLRGTPRTLSAPLYSTVEAAPREAVRASLDGPELVEHAAVESAIWAQWAEATNVGTVALEQVMAEVRTLSRDYLIGDPATLFARTRQLRDRVFRLIEGHQQPQQSADLYMAGGYLCGLLAWMSSDLGRLSAADTQGRTAWLCAELSGHTDLRAWVLSTRSKIAFWDNRLRDAVQYARHGASLTTNGTVRVLLSCQEADAWSRLGAANEARSAISRATAAREQATGFDDVDGLFSCDPFREINYRAGVSLRLGDPRAVLEAVEQCATPSPHQAFGTVAQMHISQGAAHLALREPEGALEALRPVLDLPPRMRLDPVVRRIREVADMITTSPIAASPNAIALRQNMETWCAEAGSVGNALSPETENADGMEP
ncbi:helix-turn-helix domain-containing protein [Streptomyces sp. NPDC020965]|uniref:helix-turn-helix domain-containing protein n=1 Tax=Streptomyces sp. NPDC020965 TaxID=3365105 RepID=UPI00378D9BC3